MTKECMLHEAVVELINDKTGITPKWLEIGLECINLVDKSNKAYGDSFIRATKILKILYPDGIKPDQYDDVAVMIRVLDKLSRIATDKNAFGESPWRDVVGYGILAYSRDIEKGKANER